MPLRGVTRDHESKIKFLVLIVGVQAAFSSRRGAVFHLQPIINTDSSHFLLFHSIRVTIINNFKMKLSVIYLAGFVSADEKKVPPRHPTQRLNRLVEFSAEILESGSFNMKSTNWISRWQDKFSNNAGRMNDAFERCGFYDPR